MKEEYCNFCEELKSILEKNFEEDVYQIGFHSIEKNNAVKYDGIVIYSSESSISPNFSIEPLYQNYKHGVPVDVLAEQLKMRYYSEQLQMKQMELDMSYENCKERIVFRLISYEKNEEMLKHTPHVRFLDMAVVFYVLVYQSPEKMGSFRITENLMELWNADQDTLMDLALQNANRMFPLKIHNMHQMVQNIISKKELDAELDSYFQHEIVDNITEAPVILTTESGINGASVLLYQDTLHIVSDLFQGDFYVLPSSIHEVLALPYSPGMSRKNFELKQIVSEVNRECVMQDEFLSEHVYLYDSEKDRLEILI